MNSNEINIKDTLWFPKENLLVCYHGSAAYYKLPCPCIIGINQTLQFWFHEEKDRTFYDISKTIPSLKVKGKLFHLSLYNDNFDSFDDTLKRTELFIVHPENKHRFTLMKKHLQKS